MMENKDEDDVVWDSWGFEKTVDTSFAVSWSDVLNRRNELQEQHFSLYLAINDYTPSRFAVLRWKAEQLLSRSRGMVDSVTFEHEGVYYFYRDLAVFLGKSLNETLQLVMGDVDRLYDELGVDPDSGEKKLNMVNLDMSNSDSGVSRGEIQSVVQQAKDEDAKAAVTDSENIEDVVDNDVPEMIGDDE